MQRQIKEASNFYLKPVVQPDAIGAHSKYFWIVTDPEDYNRNLVARRTVYPVKLLYSQCSYPVGGPACSLRLAMIHTHAEETQQKDRT